MPKTIVIKLTSSGSKSSLFTIKDQNENIIAEHVDKKDLIEGMTYTVSGLVTSIKMVSEGNCANEITKPINSYMTPEILANTNYTPSIGTCMWRHLQQVNLLNNFYGEIHPYILEYPFAFSANDQIVQDVKNYSKVYKYLPDGEGIYDYNERIQTDDDFFNEMVLYNGQQSTGILKLVPKPKNNLQAYNLYPIYNADSKTIVYTKSDSFYKTNNFWDVVKNKTQPLFVTSCSSLSLDKEVNQSNMDYSKKSFSKSLMRAKELRIRYILNDKSNINIVSGFILSKNQLSYK